MIDEIRKRLGAVSNKSYFHLRAQMSTDDSLFFGHARQYIAALLERVEKLEELWKAVAAQRDLAEEGSEGEEFWVRVGIADDRVYDALFALEKGKVDDQK